MTEFGKVNLCVAQSSSTPSHYTGPPACGMTNSVALHRDVKAPSRSHSKHNDIKATRSYTNNPAKMRAALYKPVQVRSTRAQLLREQKVAKQLLVAAEDGTGNVAASVA